MLESTNSPVLDDSAKLVANAMSNFEMVREFHERFECPIGSTPMLPDQELIELRCKFIDEERAELETALKGRDLVETVDALVDLLYFIYGFGVVLGVDMDAAFQEVHRSNMTKLGADGLPCRREDGKVIKGPNYTPPNLKVFCE